MTDAEFDLNEFFNLSYFEDVSSGGLCVASVVQKETADDLFTGNTSPQPQPNSHGDRQTSVTYPLSSENPGALTGADSKYQPQDVTTKSARISNRFSLESIRILRQWLADHNSYP